MSTVEEVLRSALALGEEGRWDEMVALLSETLEREPDDPYLLCWLGIAERELGHDSSAYENFRRCLAQDPVDPHLLALAGSGLAAFDDPDAETALRAAALAGPDVPMARLQYGAYLAREGLLDEALEHLRAALELSPEDPVVHTELAAALAFKGEPSSAVTELEEALELAPDDSWSRVLLGLLHVELNSFEEAAEALIHAAEERDDDAEAQMLAALAAAAVGWEEPAHAALTRAGYVAAGADAELLEEVEDRLLGGADTARTMLHDTLAPSILRERLTAPL